MNEEEKKAIKNMDRFANGIDMSIVSASQMQTILNLIEKLKKENEDITRQRDYYKARYNEFNNAFIEGGKKLTSK